MYTVILSIYCSGVKCEYYDPLKGEYYDPLYIRVLKYSYMLTHDTITIRNARIAAYATLTKNYSIYRAGDTIVDYYGNTYTVTYVRIAGYDLTIYAIDNLNQTYTFTPEQIQKVY